MEWGKRDCWCLFHVLATDSAFFFRPWSIAFIPDLCLSLLHCWSDPFDLFYAEPKKSAGVARFLEICQTWWDTFCSKGTVSHMVFFFFYLFDVLLKIQRKTETNSSLLFPTPKKSWEKSRRRHRGRQISKSPIKRDLEQLGSRLQKTIFAIIRAERDR